MPSARATEKITPLTPAAAAACRDAIDTRTDPGTPRPAAGPVHTGSDPARTDPDGAPAIRALFRSVALTPPLAGSAAAAAAPAAAGNVAVAAPAAGHVTAGRCHACGTGTFTFRLGTADTGTGLACATGRSFALPDSPAAPPGGCVIPVRNGTAVTTAHVTTATRRPRP